MNKYNCYNIYTDPEGWEQGSAEEALHAFNQYLDNETEAGSYDGTIRLGVVNKPDITDYFRPSIIFYGIRDVLDDVFEDVNDPFQHVTGDARDALWMMVEQWLRENSELDFWVPTEVQTFFIEDGKYKAAL